jgi:alpha-L-rhamnosidase
MRIFDKTRFYHFIHCRMNRFLPGGVLLSCCISFCLSAAAIRKGPVREGAVQEAPVWETELLKCEYRVNPLGIDEAQPRFSWTFRSPRRDQYQSAYHILVASSRDKLQKNIGDVWDSGTLSSVDNINVLFAGKPLRPFTRYFWKIKALNTHGEATPWSRPAWFETAFLHTHWEGSWIGDGKPIPQQKEDFYTNIPAPLFKKDFTIGKTIRSARLYISGLGYYEAYLNGQKVGDAVLDPGWTNYGKTILYSIYDITGAIKPGSNRIVLLLGNGWYNPLPMKLFGTFNLRDVLHTGQPKVIANIRVLFTDGSSRSIVTDGSWSAGDSYILKNNIYLGEEQDARLMKPTTEQQGSSWASAVVVPSPGGVMAAQTAPPIRITKIIRPVAVSSPEKGVYVFDLGRNFAGWIRMRIRGKAGATVHFLYGELLVPGGRVNGMTTVAGHIKEIWHLSGGPGSPATAYQKDSYTCKGDSTDVFQPHFTFHAFRYVEITDLDNIPGLEDLQGLRLNSDLPEAGHFTCSNPLLNRVQDITLASFLSNIFSVQSDCPGRERQGYGADMVSTAEAFTYNYDMSCFYAKTVQDFANDVRPNGGMPECAPYNGISTEGFDQGAGPLDWQLAFSFLQEKLYRFYGNTRVLEDNYQHTKNMVDFLQRQSRDHLIDHGIGDHEAVNAKHVPLTSGAFYYHHVRLLAEFAGILGKKEDLVRYTALADSIQQAFNARYLQAGTGQYDTAYNQTTQVFPLWYGLAPAAEQQAAFKALLETILQRDQGHLSTGIFGTKMLFDVLRRYDRNDVAFSINTQTGYPGYGYMLQNEATTLWESWQRPDQNSFNHPMFGSVSEWFYRSLAGINPAEDACGMDRLVIKPFTGGDLRFVRGSYESIRGRVISQWSKKEDRLDWQVTIPPNTHAKLYVPALSVGEILESGRPAEKAEGLAFIRMENGFALFDAVSGEYHIRVSPQFK